MSSFASKLITDLYVSRNTLLQQLELQGYDVSGYNFFNINEINSMYKNNQLDMLLERNTENGMKQKTYIKYFITKTLRQTNIEDMVYQIFEVEEILNSTDTLQIVVNEEMNDTIKKGLKFIFDKKGIFVIVQNLQRLLYNVLQHELVPKHRILTNEETNIVRKRFNITNDNMFPELSRYDLVAIAIGIRPNQVCEIQRDSKTSIIAIHYRICINE